LWVGAFLVSPMASPSRPASLMDPLDRAQTYRQGAIVRIKVDEIGFLPANRGNVGICPYHAHEIAWDCMSNKVKTNRYKHVDIVLIPQDKLVDWRNQNKIKCNGDALMPKYSPTMLYASLTKTHFSHAQ
jgi:hypothetical protein